MSIIANTTDTGQRVISDAEYDYAHAMIKHVERSAADPIYRLAFLEANALLGYEAVIPNLIRAIDARQDDARELVAA